MTKFRTFLSPRIWFCYILALVAALVAVIGFLAPVQLPVILYKLVLALLAGASMYGLDRALWPYANPASYLCFDWTKNPDADGGDGTLSGADFPVLEGYVMEFCVSQLRQASMVIGGMFAVCMGL